LQISGKRLLLRDIEEQDSEQLIHWLHPDHEWHKTDAPYYRKPPAHIIPNIIEKWVTAERPEIPERLVIVQKDVSENALLGTVNKYWISEETNWLAIGIAIYDSAQWGKGFGYEALGLWCEYLFQSYPGFVRLDLRTWTGNIGMMKLAEKLGFQREATFRKARIVDDKYYDGLGYGILREEWQNRFAEGFTASLKP
jgi:putative hydrolase of HD superfamily